MKSSVGITLLWIFPLLFMSFSSIRNAPGINDTPVIILIEGGEFDMGKGCEDMGLPVQKTKVKSFKISQTEITNLQFSLFLNAKGKADAEGNLYINPLHKGYKIKETEGKYIVEQGYEHHPAAFVTWRGANAYCKYVGGRLPTEAEWEYAARGGKYSKGYLFSGSDNVNEVAVLNKTGTKPVASKKSNELGLYDMSGNVMEWCQNPFIHKRLPKSEVNLKTLKGGSWDMSRSTYLISSRICSKAGTGPDIGDMPCGLRVCFDVKK